ncbi:MAG: beta-ketoacyl synthase N-terminal-like domain-containing protein [Planctomycetota bacterium]
MSRRRVVITGVGAVSPFGFGADALWDGLCAGRSAIGPIRAFDGSPFPSAHAAEVPDFKARDYVPKSYRKAVKVMSRDVQLAVAAAQLAVEHAGLVTAASEDGGEPTYPGERLGCSIGAGLVSAEVGELGVAMSRSATPEGRLDHAEWGREGMQNLTPLWLLKTLPNMLACHVTIVHGAKGPSNTITCAQASGMLSVGELARIIERGDADAGFGGSVESKVNPMGIMRLAFADRLLPSDAVNGAEPWTLVRPYDESSSGGVLGEGGGLMILESLETAQGRGATVYAEVAGFGAGHRPRGTGAAERARGLANAIRAALRDASVAPADVDVIVPTGASAPEHDREEAEALRVVFGDHVRAIPLMTLTPAIGDSVAGQGGLQVAAACIALAEQQLPARLHGGSPAADLDAARADARRVPLRTALVCGTGFGGQTAALVLRTMDP